MLLKINQIRPHSAFLLHVYFPDEDMQLTLLPLQTSKCRIPYFLKNF